MATSIRQKQVARQIKMHFSTILQNHGVYIFGHEPLVTITQVEMTPDLGLASIYLSIYNTEHKQEVILELEDNIVLLRRELAQRVRKHLRRCPDIRFFIDNTLDEMQKINDLLDRL